jgi:16S rRNA (uracil1498-N3)-methyltransferase
VREQQTRRPTTRTGDPTVERLPARLFVEADLVVGGAVEITDRAAHYLRHVLRLEPGAAVALFNGRDGEFRARITASRKAVGRLTLEACLRPQVPEPDIWLLFAPVKRARIDLIAEKATELGVARLMPVITRHTAVARVNVERLRAIAIEAAEQCTRLTVPAVDAPQPLDAVLAAWPAGRRLFAGDEAGGGMPIGAAARDAGPGPWALLVGPEGGFAEAELDALHQFQFLTAVGLGPRVLRADTAVVAALAVLQTCIGDWCDSPRR